MDEISLHILKAIFEIECVLSVDYNDLVDELSEGVYVVLEDWRA